jgi:hypothetical protein
VQLTSLRSFYRLDLGEVVISDSIENQLAHYYEHPEDGRPLLFDFSNAVYIDIAALVNCIATLVQQKEKGLESLISYPRSKRVRDFLKVWRFPETVEEVTQTEFRDFMLPGQEEYLAEQQTTYKGIGDGIDALEYDLDWDGTPLTKRNFFEFTLFSAGGAGVILPEGFLSAVPRIESRRWTGALVREVLCKHVGSDTPKDEVARVIIYEAMSNAVRHPKAHFVLCGSKFSRENGVSSAEQIEMSSARIQTRLKKLKGTLRICIWDDGEFIANTLLNPLRTGKPVRALRLPPYMCERIFVQLRSFDETVEKELILDQSKDPNAESPEFELLAASLYPGVSRTAGEPVPQVEAYSELPESDASIGPGMGLYALTRTVLDQFQGSLVIRSGNHRLAMEIAHDTYRQRHRVRYKCKITKYPTGYPIFRGNHLVIQLPVRG